MVHPFDVPAPPLDYERALNPEQREVVMAPGGPLLVIAGAGSGKTHTLTYRVARLVESGVPASSILLLTFTNKAAREMLQRVADLLRGDPRAVLGGTFHHVANVVLRQYPDRVRRSASFTILDRDDSADLVGSILRDLAMPTAEKRFPKADVLVDIASASANLGTTVDKLLFDRYAAYRGWGEEIDRVLKAYEARKEELDVCDFDDLLRLWRDLVREHADARQALSERFRHLLVDEYQDTNRLQSEIVETIAGPAGNLMVVGDDAQSIYSFRGANFGNIIDFPKRFPTARVFRLVRNYRSTPQILGLANDSISRNERQFPKELSAVRPTGPKPERVACGDAYDQARYVADCVVELLGEGWELPQIAVLYRAHWHSMELQVELTRQGIPYQVRSGTRFFDMVHVKDVAAYLKIVENGRDELAWKRILRLYPRMGKATADKVWAALATQPDPLAGIVSEAVARVVPKAAKPGYAELVRTVRGLSDPALKADPPQMIRAVLESGYKEHLVGTFENHPQRIEDLRRLADYAVKFGSLAELLAELALAGTANSAESMEEQSKGIVLTTIHQAKGLEWRAVFLLSLNEGKLPDARSMGEGRDLEEERRLFYVACTRAKDRLWLLQPTLGSERGMSGVVQEPSRFLEELKPAVYVETETPSTFG